MYTGEFEVEGIAGLTGTIAVGVHEAGEPEARIFDVRDQLLIDVDWSLTGPLQRMVCGTFGIDVYMESIGKGREFELADVDNIQVQPTGSGQYHQTITVPAGTIKTHVEKDGDVETDIVYKMVVTVTYRDPGGRPGPIAGFCELPMFQFYYDA